MSTVLVVDDDPELRAALTRAFELDGYDVSEAKNGRMALDDIAAGAAPDVIVLDLMMPVVGGLEVCRRLRAGGDQTPIIVLTARDEIGDRVAGLDAGADDYLAKPFALEELRARVRALLRRSQLVDDDTAALDFAGLRLDPESYEVTRDGRRLDLTRTEFALLELFLRNAGRVLTRDVITDRIWGYPFEPASNSLEVFVGYLRRKTEAAGEPRLIHTVRGVGYRLGESA